MVQNLQVRRLKGLILTIGPNSLRVIVKLWTRIISEPQFFSLSNPLEKKIEQTIFHFHDFSKSNLLKTWESRPVKDQKSIMSGGKVDEKQVTLCWQETTMYFSVVIDSASFSPGIVRELRDGWRTINWWFLFSDPMVHCVKVYGTEKDPYPLYNITRKSL